MIEIRNNKGDILDLYPDTSISVEKNNPLFNDNDKLFEDITYSFSSPDSETNKLFYNGGHLVETENSAYEMDVQVIVNGDPFYACKIRFSFAKGDFENILLVNFGSLATRANKIKMREIFTQDSPETLYTAAIMKTVCQNPLEYPYSFFPIWNENWNGSAVTYPMINNWDQSLQQFSLIPVNNGQYTATAPYFKLKYIVIKLMEFFELKVEGSWIDDPESDTIYCYNIVLPGSLNKIFESFLYLPTDISCSEFLKIIKERFQISCSFDVFKGVAKIESARSILKSEEILDLSSYIYEVESISVESKQGFSVTLKPDANDELFIDKINTAEKKFVPTNRLLVGSGENELELKSSTLKSKIVGDYSMPTVKQKLSSTAAKEINNPIRFIKYNGMKNLTNGKVFPEAIPMELNEGDAIWWRFLNDSKELRLRGAIPSLVLKAIGSTQRIGFKTKEGSYATALCKKTMFSLEGNKTELITTIIEARTIVANYNTVVTIETFNEDLTDTTKIKLKAFFDSNNTGLQSIMVEVYYARTEYGTNAERIDATLIKYSTDRFGIGGESVNMPSVFAMRKTIIEIRVKSGFPKYAILNSIKYNFSERDGYWFFAVTGLFTGDFATDNRGIWIVF